MKYFVLLLSLALSFSAAASDDIRVLINGKTYICSENGSTGNDFFTCEAFCMIQGYQKHKLAPQSGRKEIALDALKEDCEKRGPGSYVFEISCTAI